MARLYAVPQRLLMTSSDQRRENLVRRNQPLGTFGFAWRGMAVLGVALMLMIAVQPAVFESGAADPQGDCEPEDARCIADLVNQRQREAAAKLPDDEPDRLDSNLTGHDVTPLPVPLEDRGLVGLSARRRNSG